MSEIKRCEICGWPLADKAEDGCVPDNCSYRPHQGTEEWRRIQRRRKAVAEREALATIEQALERADAAEAEVERLQAAWDCDGETHGPWCREWKRMEAEVERLRDALVVISGGICASAPDKHLDPPGIYCGGACYVCIARAALGKDGNDETL